MSEPHVHSYAVVKMTVIKRYKEAFLQHKYWEQRLKNDYNITPQELQQIQNKEDLHSRLNLSSC